MTFHTKLTLIGAKPLCIMFYKFDGFIKDIMEVNI